MRGLSRFANLRAVPFAGPPPRGVYMPLPSHPTGTLVGPSGMIEWLRQAMPKVHARIKDKAPHLLVQSLHGILGQMTPQDIREASQTPDVIDTITVTGTTPDAPPVLQPIAFTYDVPMSAQPAADPTLPGGQAGGWADTLAKLAGPVITGFEQVKLFNTQLSLAQQGKPLLKASQIQLPTVPFGVSLTADTSTKLVLGALGVGLLFLLFGGRRRG